MALSKILPAGQDQFAGARNLVTNGAMTIAQRGTSETGVTTSGYKTVDRFRASENSLGTAVFTHAQATDAPDGFANSLKLTTTTAEGAVAAADRFGITYDIEGQDLQHLQYGTSSAKKVTLSFYVKSSLTGTYSVAFYATNASNRLITSTYTINSTDTWELKTITFDGDTSVAFTNDNTAGLTIFFNLGAGSDSTSTDSTSWIDYASTGLAYGQTAQFQNTLNATWQVTGVQLEVGETATPFEHRSYGDELARCQRYFQDYTAADSNHLYINGTNESSSEVGIARLLPVVMRVAPTALNATTTSGTVGSVGTKKNMLQYFTASGHGSGGFSIRFQFDAEL
jgi:hypothetical protein